MTRDVPEWDSLSDDERRLYARMMEVYAGFVSHADHHLGRVLDTLEQIGELENTLVMVISDNGASAEGGVTGSFNEMLFFDRVPENFDDNLAMIDELGGTRTYNHYAWGWTWAGNTPFRRWKRETYRGGATDPFVVSWPARIAARGEVRSQYAHAIDLVPTVLDALSVEPPAAVRGVKQSPIEGVSFVSSFDAADAPTSHTTQYFEMFGHRAIYHDGWRAVCPWPGPNYTEAAAMGRRMGEPITPEVLEQLDASGWELYNINVDPTESSNVAAEHPDQLRELIALWWRKPGSTKCCRWTARYRHVWRRSVRRHRAPHPFHLSPAHLAGPGLRGATHLQSAPLHRGRRRDSGPRGKWRSHRTGWRCRRLHLLRGRRAPALRVQLRRTRAVRGVLVRTATSGTAYRSLRVRAHRSA